jgi:hypothetical protein
MKQTSSHEIYTNFTALPGTRDIVFEPYQLNEEEKFSVENCIVSTH